MTDTITERLDRLFSGLRPTPTEDIERLSPGEKLLQQDPALWKAVQHFREQQAEKQADAYDKHQMFEMLQLASDATGLTLAQLEDRLSGVTADSADFAEEAFGPDSETMPFGEQQARIHDKRAARYAASGDEQGAAKEQSTAAKFRQLPNEANR